jgi:hypothetical protein
MSQSRSTSPGALIPRRPSHHCIRCRSCDVGNVVEPLFGDSRWRWWKVEMEARRWTRRCVPRWRWNHVSRRCGGEGAVEDLRGPSPGGALSGGSVAAAKVGCLLCEIRSRKWTIRTLAADLLLLLLFFRKQERGPYNTKKKLEHVLNKKNTQKKSFPIMFVAILWFEGNIYLPLYGYYIYNQIKVNSFSLRSCIERYLWKIQSFVVAQSSL